MQWRPGESNYRIQKTNIYRAKLPADILTANVDRKHRRDEGKKAEPQSELSRDVKTSRPE